MKSIKRKRDVLALHWPSGALLQQQKACREEENVVPHQKSKGEGGGDDGADATGGYPSWRPGSLELSIRKSHRERRPVQDLLALGTTRSMDSGANTPPCIAEVLQNVYDPGGSFVVCMQLLTMDPEGPEQQSLDQLQTWTDAAISDVLYEHTGGIWLHYFRRVSMQLFTIVAASSIFALAPVVCPFGDPCLATSPEADRTVTKSLSFTFGKSLGCAMQPREFSNSGYPEPACTSSTSIAGTRL